MVFSAILKRAGVPDITCDSTGTGGKEGVNMAFCKQFHADPAHFWYAAGTSVMRGEEFHAEHEILYLYQAEGRFLSEGESVPLHPDMLLLIPKEHFHNFTFSREEEYRRCRLWFPDVPEWACLLGVCMDRIRILHTPTPEIVRLFQGLRDGLFDSRPEEEKALLLRTAAVQLLFAIRDSLGCFSASDARDENSLIARALSYVNRYYRTPVTLAQAAAALFVSTSQLSHCFSRELNISFYQYVQQKRLVCARQLIRSGRTAAEAAAQSGFSEYSSFFRAYKKHYGCAPSHPTR